MKKEDKTDITETELEEVDTASLERIHKHAEDDYDNHKKKGTVGDEFVPEKVFVVETIVGIVLLVILLGVAAFLLLKDKNKTEDTAPVVSEVTSVEIAETTSEEDELTTETSDNQPAIDIATVNRDELPEGELPQVYTAGNMIEYTGDAAQMAELYKYWDDYNLEAVHDLINLARIRAMTDTLKGSDDFFYYGDLNEDGLADGKGLAIYAENTYYFGEWRNGHRQGDGMWLRLFINGNGVVNGVKGVAEHQYSGKWRADYPNGDGQETFIYNSIETDKEYIIRNAIGKFTDGYYDGNMYVITQSKNSEDTTDWYGVAQMGSFSFVNDKVNSVGKRPIWEAGNGCETGEQDNCRWIMPNENIDFGIAGLKK